MGRVTRLAVEEGQRVKAGQFLLEIDPRSLDGQCSAGEASGRRGAVLLRAVAQSVEQATGEPRLARRT